MSKRFLVPTAVAAAMVAMASYGLAGDYHFGVTLLCTDCHVMHYSQSHGYNPNGGGFYTPLGAAGPYTYLLRNDINNLCLSCHDGQGFAPDVFEANTNVFVRQAGALNEVGGNSQYPPTTGHTLRSTATAPGGTFANPDGLNCADCHAVHGRASGLPGSITWGGYRNLFSTTPGFVSISYSRGDVEGPNPPNSTYWIHEARSSGVNVDHYGINGITFNEPDPAKSRYADFCKTCHTNFHGDVGGTEIGGSGSPPEHFHRHPAGGVNIGAIGGGHSNLGRLVGKANQIQVMSPLGQKPKPYGSATGYDGTDTGLTPSCMSCHKSHGNQNAFGLIYMVGAGTVTEQGDNGTGARNTCRQCHIQGGAASNPW